MSKDECGDRMKAYEGVEAQRRLNTDLPIVARIDGRSFSKFTKPFEKPFDKRVTAVMDATTEHLVRETHAKIGYTQSDEITLVWYVDRSENPAAQMLFDGRTQKLCSVLAGMATSRFVAELVKQSEKTRTMALRACPHFDCRIWNVPTKIEAANTVLWRFLDARKNAVSSFTRAHMSHKKMQGLSSAEQIAAVVNSGGPNFYQAVSPEDRFGRSFYRETVERPLTIREREVIPQKHQPDPGMLVTRTEVTRHVVNWAELTADERVERIFVR